MTSIAISMARPNPTGSPSRRSLDGEKGGSACTIMKGNLMAEKVNLAEKLALLEKHYVPAIVGYINDYKLQVVKPNGPFVWHKHDETDDFFLVIRGRLTIHLRDRDVTLDPWEFFVVPRGVEHCPDAEPGTEVLLIEPSGTVNTGDAGGSMTTEPLKL